MSTDDGDMMWSITVKTVGGDRLPSNDFPVTVSPDENVQTLYDKIQGITGLSANEQRLIYRGRLIGESNESAEGNTKIKDIVGLEDGHTIHLIRKRVDTTPSSSSETATASTTPGPRTTSAPDNFSFGSGSSLLGALLGLNQNGGGDDATSSNVGGGANEEGSPRWRSRYSARRRTHHRLTADDIEVRDPGSMESVRQGLMTLHTLMNTNPTSATTAASASYSQTETADDHHRHAVLDVNRRWYRGQWIDCRDTVNQWLEATVVEILSPDAILGSRSSPRRARGRTTTQPATDPAVSAGDLEGRRMLLLEPCQEGDSDDEGSGFRRRDTNEGVQLLLIHYNGWPHRWDEWIRSDSERIRPFRVRTRHPTTSSTMSPTPLSSFAEAPSTFIRSEDESQDRQALLPELVRVMSAVSMLLNEVSQAAPSTNVEPPVSLPWSGCPSNDGSSSPDDHAILPVAEEPVADESENPAVVQEFQWSRRDVEALPALLDRLGRTLVDAAPHVASLAASLNREEDRAAEQATPIDEAPHTLGGLLSLLGHSRRRQSNASSNAAVTSDTVSASVGTTLGASEGDTVVSTLDPDYTDYVGGVVNTTRGEVRHGPRNRISQSDDFANLLSAYLAASTLGLQSNEDEDSNGNAQGLGRLLRERGGNGGIDIHIHAVVTAPGVAPNVGLALEPPSPTNTNNNNTNNAPATTMGTLFSRERRESTSRRLRHPPVVSPQEDDMGIFSELYSETPDPVNHNATPAQGGPTAEVARRGEEESVLPRMARANSSFAPARPTQRSTIRRTAEGRRFVRRRFPRIFRRSSTSSNS